MNPEYPVYIISKGRSDICLTAKALIKDDVPFSLVVEPQEADAYAERFGQDRLLILPFANLGLGSIPARNWVWEHSIDSGAQRHWILDDNIRGFWRRWKSKKIPTEAGVAFRSCEIFTDRYTNIAISGMNYYMFAPDSRKAKPFRRNCHVYFNLLIRNDLPFRWRGRYNEDTDLCLQALALGHCTVQFNHFLAWKETTMTMKGGNTDELYTGDGRLDMAMAMALERMWPGVVTVDRRFGRPQHVVNWTRFPTPLCRRTDIDWEHLPPIDDLGMKLIQKREAKNGQIDRLIEGES